jgi:hypothetical protein
MPLSMYQVSIPVFVRGLGVLATLLDKAAAHAGEQGIDPATLVEARLAPDMMTLAAQIQRASDTSKLAAERLTGRASPRFEDTERTLPELQQRIAATVAYLTTIDDAAMADSEQRSVTLNFGSFKPTFTGQQYLLTFALPNFFFHVTTAYDILRHQGLAIGKRDYLGPYAEVSPP